MATKAIDKVRHDAALLALPVPQAEAIASLVMGKSVTEAAGEAGVSRATVHRWLADDPAFVAAHNSLRRELAETVDQGLRVLALQAVEALREILTSKRTAPALKLKAAVAVLEIAAGRPATGPATVEDAETSIALSRRARDLRRRMAR